MRRTSTIVALAALLGLAAASATAEVSVLRAEAGEVEPFFEPGREGPWGRVRSGIPVHDLLNETGDGRGDGWPVIHVNVASELPEVAWSSGGEDREIFFAVHDTAEWSRPLNLSMADGADEVPVLVSDENGNRYLAWQRLRNGRGSIFFAGMPAGPPRLVMPVRLSSQEDDARRPDLVTTEPGLAWIAYEEHQNGSDGVKDVVVERLDVPLDDTGLIQHGGLDTIDLARLVVVETAWPDAADDADARVHFEDDHLWVTWRHDATTIGFVEFDGGSFTEPSYRPHDEEAGPDEAREQIREEVLD